MKNKEVIKMEVPFNPGEEPRSQRNHRDIQEIARRLRDYNFNRIVESPRTNSQRYEQDVPTFLSAFRKVFKYVLCFIALYFGFRLFLLLIIVLENSL
jgi:hypothetical protein